MRTFLMSIAAATVAATALLTACGKRVTLKPGSGGRPYEVLVSGDSSEAVKAVGSMLRATDVPGLPQSEAAFDVSETGGTPGSSGKYARCIVVTDIDAGQYTATRVRYERDVYAEPQIIIYVCSPSTERLRADSAMTARSIARLANRFEMKTEAGRLTERCNRKAEKAGRSMTGHGIYIPEDLTVTKRGNGFIWFSDNSATAMRNICVYTYGGTDTRPETVVRMRDSIMGANIKGETDAMRMRTEGKILPEAAQTGKDAARTIVRGLWMMDGDAMGGPFAAHAVTDSARGTVVVAEAFVYAPGVRKRNLIRQLEAALYTLK